MKLGIAWLAGLFCLSVTTLAVAHPGHGVTPPDGLLHQAVEPAHHGLVWLALLVLLVSASLWKWRRRSQRQPARAPRRHHGA